MLVLWQHFAFVLRELFSSDFINCCLSSDSAVLSISQRFFLKNLLPFHLKSDAQACPKMNTGPLKVYHTDECASPSCSCMLQLCVFPAWKKQNKTAQYIFLTSAERLRHDAFSSQLLSDHLGWKKDLPGTDGVFALTDGH